MLRGLCYKLMSQRLLGGKIACRCHLIYSKASDITLNCEFSFWFYCAIYAHLSPSTLKSAIWHLCQPQTTFTISSLKDDAWMDIIIWVGILWCQIPNQTTHIAATHSFSDKCCEVEHASFTHWVVKHCHRQSNILKHCQQRNTTNLHHRATYKFQV